MIYGSIMEFVCWCFFFEEVINFGKGVFFSFGQVEEDLDDLEKIEVEVEYVGFSVLVLSCGIIVEYVGVQLLYSNLFIDVKSMV